MDYKVIYFLCLLTVGSADITCDLKPTKELFCVTDSESTGILQASSIANYKSAVLIKLNNCDLKIIDSGVFKGFLNLKTLDLSNNAFDWLNHNTFSGLEQLKSLNLSQNNLADFTLSAFLQVSNLIELDLSSNSIKSIRAGTFDALTNLKFLDLSNNDIEGRKLNSNTFTNNQALEVLKISDNDMNKVHEDFIKSLINLKILYLNSDSLDSVPRFIKKAKALENLFLSRNEINNLEATSFTGLENLKQLNLDFNMIRTIHEETFKSLQKLEAITLKSNKLEIISDRLFQNLPKLTEIDLSSNLIQNLPANSFRGAPLKQLNIASNRITYLQDNFCLELRNSGAKLNRFIFYDNPWQCACLVQLLDEVKRSEVEYKMEYYNGIIPVCVSVGWSCDRHESANSFFIYNYEIAKSNSGSS